MIDSPEFRDLCTAITSYYGEDLHLWTPHPETVKAIALAVPAAIDVSKSRPAKYANEPWLCIGTGEHLEHAAGHLFEAYESEYSGYSNWLDDDNLPNAAHGILRAAFGVYRHEVGQ